MDISEKEEFSAEKRNCDNYDSVNIPSVDWRISGSNLTAPTDSYPPPENLISACPSSCSPSQLMDSFGQTLWYDPTNVQAVGYSGFNVQSNGGNASSSSSFRGNIDRSLEMGWNLPNLLPPKGNGLFLPNASGFLPPSMAQFPADSGFIERAARFSLFSGGNFSDMANQPLGNPDSIGLLLQGGGTMQGQCPSSELNVGEPHNASTAVKDSNGRSSEQAKPNVPGSENVSEDTQSSGGNGQKGGETSSKGFATRKRKRNGQNCEEAQSHRSQQSEEEPENNGDKNENGEQSPNSPGNKTNSGKQQGKQTTSDPPKDGYIHVRARRGQATNSHSLAERVRREKISERMKFLQDLVPGCNKVTGKAVMLDEIINYVQSLQRQVEFLSMKLATVNPQMDFNLEGLLSKDEQALQLRAGSSSATPFPQNMSMSYPPLPHAFMQQTLSSIGRTISAPMSPMNGGGYKRQETNGWEGDLQNVIHINYGAGDVPPDPQAATTASHPAANMKVEP